MEHEQLTFPQIYDLFHAKIQRYLARMVGAFEAEDLAQEVFLRVSHSVHTFRGESQLSTWIYRIATNAALDRLRSPAFRAPAQPSLLDPAVEPEIVLMEERPPTVEQQLVRKEMNACIRAFVQRLPAHYQAVLVLSEFEGLCNKEIAEVLGVSLETVKIRLHRARAKLRHDLLTQCDSCWIEDNEFVPDLRSTHAKLCEEG